ncbi:SAM-dependent methyltransferase [Asanoa siamensis]|nr:SAM-dependent methyltransferase [Asanoa siamensis]
MTGVDFDSPHSARIWNYWLGGTDNFPVDRAVGDEILELLPDVATLARASRGFLERAVTFLASAGVRQFLDIGTGLPTANNTHQVAQAVAPSSRVVYVDNDPLVLVHARTLLTGTVEGATAYVEADLRDPARILTEATHTLDFSQPVAVTLMGILHHVTDTSEAHSILATLLAAVPPGSYLALSHATNVIHGAASDEVVRQWNEVGGEPLVLRSPGEIEAFCTGLDILPPGVVSVSRWRPTGETPPEVDEFGVVARKH